MLTLLRSAHQRPLFEAAQQIYGIGRKEVIKNEMQVFSELSFGLFTNPNDVVHGGVIYSIADTGMGAAVFSTLEDGEFCATLEIKIMYLKPAGHFDLICHTQVIKKGRRVAFLESEILSNKELIAKASGSLAIF